MLQSAYKQQASAMNSILTQKNSDLGNQTSGTHADDQFAKVNEKKRQQ